MDNLSYTTNQDIITLLCQRLKEYRLAARISQKEMAEKSGVSLTTISHLEQGVNRNITLNNFISLLRVLGMEQRLSDLLPELPVPASAGAWHGTAFVRPAARTARPPDGLETDEQVHTQTSKEEQ